MRESVETSLRNLRTTYLDVLLCHDVEFAADPSQIIRETIPELIRLRNIGVVRFVGISAYPLDSLLLFAKNQLHQNPNAPEPLDVILSYCHNTLHNTQLWKSYRRTEDGDADDGPCFAKRAMQEAGVRNFIAASPLAMGLITESGPPSWHPASPELRDACRKCVQLCAQRRVDIADLALRYAFEAAAESGVQSHTTLIGFSSPQEVQKAVDSFLKFARRQRKKPPLAGEKSADNLSQEEDAGQGDADLMALIREILRPVYNSTWKSPPDD